MTANKNFHDAIKNTVCFLTKEKIPYFVLGGLAVGVLGEARFTYDIDITVLLNEDDYGVILKRLKKTKFSFNAKEAMLSILQFGSFRIFYKKVQIDLILLSTELEKSAMKRRKKIKFMNEAVYFPSPEDLILFKLLANRPKDILDAQTIIWRHKKTLDKKYLLKWAKQIYKESENQEVLDQIKKLIS